MSPLVRICATLVLVIASLPPECRVSPAVTVGSRVYARAGESVTLLCQTHYPESRAMTSPVGFWKRAQGRELSNAAVVVQYLSNVRTSSTSDLSQRSRVSERRQFGNFSLLISKVRAGDAGFFLCDFTFRSYRATAMVELRVIRGFTDPLHRSVFLLTRSVALLPCYLNQLPPDSLPLRVSWHRDGHELMSLNASGYPWNWQSAGHPWVLTQEPRPPTNLSVGLRAVSLAQGGEYQCQASSSEVTAFRTVMVIVMEVSSSDPGPVVRGRNTTLRCQLSQNTPETRLQWRHSNQSQSPQVETARGSGSLYIHLIEVTEREAGQWICETYQKDRLIGIGTYSLNITEPYVGRLGDLPLIQIIGISTGFLVFLLILCVTVVCLIKRSRRRRRALKRLRHPLCREHSYQLSNQPLCPWNDYSAADRPLPPPPVRYCPHRQPRKGDPSPGRGGRTSSRKANGGR